MKRLLRAGALALALAGVLGTSVQPASATVEVGAVAFVGHAVVHPGIADPLFPDPPNLTKVPDPLNPSFGDNSASYSFTTDTCVGITVTANKAKPPVSEPNCTITALGLVHGFCGFSHGTGHGALSVGSQHFSFSFSFTGFVPGLVVTGTIHKHTNNSSGPLAAVVNATPPPPGDPTSCVTKGPHSFRIIGVAASVLLSLP